MKRIAYVGHEEADTRFHDGALRPVIGAWHIQVMRANREHPELSQGTDFTYNHAPMICRWKGRFYLLYLSGPVHEHAECTRAMLTSSEDGLKWSVPELAFEDIPVPFGVYRGRGAEKMREGARSIVHHRMGFYTARNGVLLVMTHHGVTPDIHIIPNSGYGMGRVIRRIHEDGRLGEVFVLRINREAGWSEAHFPYRMYDESEDKEFIDACHELLSDHLANGAWWEEERLNETFFPLQGIRAPSFQPLDDGTVVSIGKMGLAAFSIDGGKTWTKPETASGIITAGGKSFITRTGNGQFAILYNPSPDGQHRWPLCIITSDDGYTYDHMYCAGGEVPPIRYGGYLKSIGMNYIRGIMPGNDDEPDGYTWAAYSMNKEDIWVVRLPEAIRAREMYDVHDDFSFGEEALSCWHVYSPLWASVSCEAGCLVMRDGDPYDYAKAIRTFMKGRNARINLIVSADDEQTGELQIDVVSPRGLCAVRVFLKHGQIRVRGGNGEIIAGVFDADMPVALVLEVDCKSQNTVVRVDGTEACRTAFMCPVLEVERLVLRTGDVRVMPTPDEGFKDVLCEDLPHAGERQTEAVFRIARVDIESNV